MLADKIGQLVVAQVNFNNKQLEAAVENLNAKNAALTRAAVKLEGKAEDDEALNTVAEGCVELASEFGKAFPELDEDQVARVKGLFGDVFDNEDPEVEAAAEEIFNATLDYNLAAQELNRAVNERVPGDEE